MRCHEIEPLLATRRDLSRAQEQLVQAHLSGCRACSSAWQREERTSRVLQRLPAPRRQPAVRPFVPPRSSPLVGLRWSGARLALGGLALCLLLGLFVGQGAVRTALGWPAPRTSTPGTATPSPTAMPATPAPGPTGPARIGLVEDVGSLKQLSVIEGDGSGQRPFFDQLVAGTCVRWSPDGSRVAYFSPGYELQLVEDGGTQALGLGEVFEDQKCPLWAADSRHMLLEGGVDEGPVHGNSASRIVLLSHPDKKQGLRGGVGISGDVAWAPDKPVLAYAVEHVDSLRTDVEDPAVVIQGLDPRGALYQPIVVPGQSVTWAPDGQHLALFTSDYAGAPLEIVIIRPDGGEERRLPLRDVDNGRFLTWSPDGRWLSWLTMEADGEGGGDWALNLIAADGTGQRVLAGQVEQGEPVLWSPDSTALAFMRLDETRVALRGLPGERGLSQESTLPVGYGYVVDLAGSEPRLVAGEIQRMAWAPDGGTLALIKYDPATLSSRASPAPYVEQPGARSDLYLVAPDGSGLRQLTSSGLVSDIAWLPAS